MAETPIVELDFFQIKEQLKSYLKNQTQFKDYNFEGSNMSVLLDVLAYNTYQNNFYTNMAISEMFLDSAQLESTVMSHAKELNYLPRSATSSKALVNLRIVAQNLTDVSRITIPAGQKFTTTHRGDTFDFFTSEPYIASLKSGSNSIYEVKDVAIYEGQLVSETFTFNPDNPSLIISNDNIDISSLSVTVNGTKYSMRTNIFGVGQTENVFYVEPNNSGSYAVSFGRNIFGREPKLNNKIILNYRVSTGKDANGATKFSSLFTYPITVTALSPAAGGADRESIDSIKFFAPKSIQTQERAVTANDYETLLKREFGSSIIRSVSVYGGDTLDPPKFGKIAVSINPQNGVSISESVKTSIVNYLSDKVPIPLQPIFIDPEYLYAKLDVKIYFSRRLTAKTLAELETDVRKAIANYNNRRLSDFGSVLQLSRLTSIIDEIDPGIVSNTIEANPIIDYSPLILQKYNPSFNFGSKLIKPYPYDQQVGSESYIPAIKSTVYRSNGISIFFQDDGEGNLITLSSNTKRSQILNPIIGTVNYNNGRVRLINFETQGYRGSAIKIYANTEDKNIRAPKNRVLEIRDSDVEITFIGVA